MYTTPTPNNHFDEFDEPRLHLERLLKTKLTEFDISLRILIPLEKNGIRTLGDLVKQSRKSLSKISQLGRVSLDRIELFVHYHGLDLTK